jgi:diacylglycerol O-acyltransferase / wax synthase
MSAAERLSGVDRAWLLMERPTNPMTIVGLIVLEGHLRRARLRDLIAERFLMFDRFRCIPVADGSSANWVSSRQFDVNDHVLRVALPAHAGQHELEALVGELASTPLNPARPLWTFHLVERFRGGSAIIVRIHHCYADGMALVQVLLSLGDGTPGAGAPRAGLANPGPPDRSATANAVGLWPQVLGRVLREGADLLEKGLHYALHPADSGTAMQDALKFAAELAHIATQSDDPPTCLKRPLSGVRRVAWADPISLEEVRVIGKVLGCTINDVLVSLLSGALGRYLESQGDNVTALKIRATVPVSLRSDAAGQPTLGNRFGLVFVELPIGMRHPLERLYAVRSTMKSLKSSPQALAVLGLLAAVGNLPGAVEEPLVALFSAKASLVASNLAGPGQKLHMDGVGVSQVLFWVPQSGSIGTGVSMLTYNGQVQFGVIADRQLVPNPAELVELIVTEFERLVFLVLLGGGSLGD